MRTVIRPTSPRSASVLIMIAGTSLAFSGCRDAGPERTEVYRPTTELEDGKPNSDEVPNVYAIDADFERTVILRFKHQADLLEDLEAVVEAEGISNAVILAGAGSVRNYQIHMVNNRDFPSRNVYLKDSSTPADLVSVNGYVIDGRVHAHLTLATEEGAIGGHLEPETEVFTFAILTLGVLSDDVDLGRIDDKTYR
jgi:uncharacterized protein